MTNQLLDFESFGTVTVQELEPATHRPAKGGDRIGGLQAELLSRALAGDQEAFYQLVKPNERMIYSMAFSMLRNQEDAEDVAQESVLKAFMHLASFRGDCKFGTWLAQIVINEGRMRLRKRSNGLFASLDSSQQDDEGNAVPWDMADSRPVASDIYETKELGVRLERAIARLAPIYREVFVLRDVNQMSIAETAKALKISEASVKTRLLRARLKMREALSEYQIA